MLNLMYETKTDQYVLSHTCRETRENPFGRNVMDFNSNTSCNVKFFFNVLQYPCAKHIPFQNVKQCNSQHNHRRR